MGIGIGSGWLLTVIGGSVSEFDQVLWFAPHGGGTSGMGQRQGTRPETVVFQEEGRATLRGCNHAGMYQARWVGTVLAGCTSH